MEINMKVFKFLLPLVAAWGLVAPAICAAFDRGDTVADELNDHDFQALRDFLNSKRTIPLEEKDCNLTISGDVRTEWRHRNEKENGKTLLGGRALGRDGLPYGRNDFDMEVNLRFDYVCDKAWAVTRIQFDNNAGIEDSGWPCCPRNENGDLTCCADCEKDHKEPKHFIGCGRFDPYGAHGSGTCDRLCLKDAYMGYNICCNGSTRFDVELGRHSNLYKVFESEVQFLSRMDGLLLKVASQWECVGDWYIQAAGFVVDERVNHFAYVGELGLSKICDTGLDFKYSFINWVKNGRNRCCVRNPAGFEFRNSQFTLGFDTTDMVCYKSRLFGAYLWNHAAKKCYWTNVHGKQNRAWYVGFEIGRVVVEGDWAVKVQYQDVGALSVPDFDMSGIGNGNVWNNSLTATGRGNTNFRGWRFDGLYAITDNLSINPVIEWSRTKDSNIGAWTRDGRRHKNHHKYSKVELEAIYAF